MPAPIQITLSKQDKQRLWHLRLGAQSQRVWRRTSALLMLGGGEPVSKVARYFGASIGTVTNWKRRWTTGRFFQLADRSRSGRPPAANDRYRKLLVEAIERGPQRYGYLFTVWSAGRLAAHLKRISKVSLSGKQVRFWLNRLGYVFRRPKHTLRSRQNPRAVQAAKVRLKALKKGLSSLLPSSNFGSKMKQTSIFILI